MNVWIIGSGFMAGEYIKALKALNYTFKVIGRGDESSALCQEKYGCNVISGGLDKFLETKPDLCTHAIVTVNVDQLASTSYALLNYGIKNILLEKPAGRTKEEIFFIMQKMQEKNANVYVAYNRRFFASVLRAKEIVKQDGGVSSFNFEFTEWSHIIEKINEPIEIKQKYVLANSSHVIDLAFYLGGKPKEIWTFSKKGSLAWHPCASIFCGAGESDSGALFSYQANWESAGRWGVEILTKEHRLILRPMEKLQIQKRGSISQDYDEFIDYSLDDKYKPGLYLQTKNFLEGNFHGMCLLEEQYKMIDIYNKIANYR